MMDSHGQVLTVTSDLGNPYEFSIIDLGEEEG